MKLKKGETVYLWSLILSDITARYPGKRERKEEYEKKVEKTACFYACGSASDRNIFRNRRRGGKEDRQKADLHGDGAQGRQKRGKS